MICRRSLLQSSIICSGVLLIGYRIIFWFDALYLRVNEESLSTRLLKFIRCVVFRFFLNPNFSFFGWVFLSAFLVREVYSPFVVRGLSRPFVSL